MFWNIEVQINGVWNIENFWTIWHFYLHILNLLVFRGFPELFLWDFLNFYNLTLWSNKKVFHLKHNLRHKFSFACYYLTVGTRLWTNVRTISRLVETMISDSPMHTPWRWSDWSDSRPFSRIGMISGKTLSPNFLTRSPRVLAATC